MLLYVKLVILDKSRLYTTDKCQLKVVISAASAKN